MCEYLKLKIENWNLYVKCLEFENLKTEICEFGCVNIESWKLKIEISLWNIWKESKILNTEISGYWKLEIEMFKYWKLKCLDTENWNVRILKIENWNVWILKIEISISNVLKFLIASHIWWKSFNANPTS
jgi:hypothetical protein